MLAHPDVAVESIGLRKKSMVATSASNMNAPTQGTALYSNFMNLLLGRQRRFLPASASAPY